LAELSQRERLQPSLLDRLTDEEPERRREGPDKRFFSPARLRDVIKRDLAWLLNTCNLSATQDLDEYPEVARSVLNYGVPDLTGTSLSSLDVAALERVVRQVIIDFEPRLLRGSVRVRAFVGEDRMSRNSLTFQIEADLWAYPAPLDIVLQSEFDLESGLVSVRE
jgi:type VI secretion system protein ImpF